MECTNRRPAIATPQFNRPVGISTTSTASVTGVEDKVDIDQELHTSSENRRTLLRVSRGTDLTADTRDFLINHPSASLTNSIPLGDLRVGDQLCVRTDRDRIARVTFTRIRPASSPGS